MDLYAKQEVCLKDSQSNKKLTQYLYIHVLHIYIYMYLYIYIYTHYVHFSMSFNL